MTQIPTLQTESLDQISKVLATLPEHRVVAAKGTPRLVSDGSLLSFGAQHRLWNIDTEGAMDSIFKAAGIPKQLGATTPSRIMLPLLNYRLKQIDDLQAIVEDSSLLQVMLAHEVGPAIEPQRALEIIAETYPETRVHKYQVNNFKKMDFLLITEDAPLRLEEFLNPDTHKKLPRGGEPFRTGVHIAFSPIGATDPTIRPYMVRLICTNGAIHQEYMTEFGKGYGEGDEIYQWFRQGLVYAHDQTPHIIEGYGHMVEEDLPPGDGTMLAVEGMIRNTTLPRALADGVRTRAIAQPPRTMYDIYNLVTDASTHMPATLDEQIKRITRAGSQASPSNHSRYCPTCHRN